MAVYDHLPLRRLEGALERRQHGFGKVVPRDAKQHGEGLKQTIDAIITTQKGKAPIANIYPALILKIQTTGGIGEDVWQALGMTLLSDEDNKSVVLFASDTELTEFKRRVKEYRKDPPPGQKNPAYAGLVGAIESVAELAPEDRIGSVLRSEAKVSPEDFADEVVETLDVELWQPSADTVLSFATRVEGALHAHNGELVNDIAGCR